MRKIIVLIRLAPLAYGDKQVSRAAKTNGRWLCGELAERTVNSATLRGAVCANHRPTLVRPWTDGLLELSTDEG
jgi:hypothetical protein